MAKKKVHSFDLFDTLVARLHTDPKSIFTLVEKNYPFPNFTNFRVFSERTSNGTLDDIYRRFSEIAHIDPAEAQNLKELEIQTELEQVYPIVQNLNAVQDGDIIVSDTYYDEQTLRKILTQVGLNKSVEIFVSPSGKSTAKIWEELQKNYEIIEHFGDNLISDYLLPQRIGMQAQHFPDATYTTREKEIISYGQIGLANLIRAVRLSNPYPKHSSGYYLWDEQAKLNLEILILVSFFIKDLSDEKKLKKILFTMRDSCHLFRIFKTLFPNVIAESFVTSRLAYESAREPFINYVKSKYDSDTMIVDLQGSGTTCIEFIKKFLKKTPFFFSIVGKLAHHKELNYIVLGRDKIERLNYDLTGTIVDFNDHGPVFNKLEYDPKYIEPYHACVQKCLDLMQHFEFTRCHKLLIEKLNRLNGTNLIIEQYLEHVGDHRKDLQS